MTRCGRRLLLIAAVLAAFLPVSALALDEATIAALGRLDFAMRTSDRTLFRTELQQWFDRDVAAVERAFATRVTGFDDDAPLPLATVHGALTLAWAWQSVDRAVHGATWGRDPWGEVLIWLERSKPWLLKTDAAVYERWRGIVAELRASQEPWTFDDRLIPLRADTERLLLRVFPRRAGR